jgi:hypothetical protein
MFGLPSGSMIIEYLQTNGPYSFTLPLPGVSYSLIRSFGALLYTFNGVFKFSFHLLAHLIKSSEYIIKEASSFSKPSCSSIREETSMPIKRLYII